METSLSMDYALGTQVPGSSDISNLASRLIKLLGKVSLVNELMQDDILHPERTSPGTTALCSIVISRASVMAASRLPKRADLETACFPEAEMRLLRSEALCIPSIWRSSLLYSENHTWLHQSQCFPVSGTHLFSV